MTPIVGHVQRLRRLVQSRVYQPEDIEKGLERMEWLIGQYVKRATTLLDVSRITTGKLKLDIAPVDLSELTRLVLATHEPAANFSRTVLNASIPDGVELESDWLALEQILDNLLLNAIKYGSGKPVDIAIEMQGEECHLVVRDRGIGISAEAQARIFEQFERAVATPSQAGFGVGLWVVRQLVDAMGGQIVVESVPDKGSTFKVALPRKFGQES